MQQLLLLVDPLCCKHCARVGGVCRWTMERGPHDAACFECGPFGGRLQ